MPHTHCILRPAFGQQHSAVWLPVGPRTSMPHTTCVVACWPKDQYASHYLCGCLLAQGPVCLTLPVWLPVGPRRTSMPHTTCVVACRPKKDQYASHSWYGCLSAQHYKCVSQYASYPSVQDTVTSMTKPCTQELNAMAVYMPWTL